MKKETIASTSELERIAFLEVYEELFKLPNDNYEKHLHITYKEDSDSFDMFIHIYDNEGNKVMSNIIEVKVRNDHYQGLILEEYKYKSLLKLKKIEEQAFSKVKIWYLNFTPKGTYLFNLDETTLEWYHRMLQKSQVYERGEKLKKVADCDISQAIKRLDFIFDKDKADNKKLKEQFKKQNIQRCIFESVKNLK